MPPVIFFRALMRWRRAPADGPSPASPSSECPQDSVLTSGLVLFITFCPVPALFAYVTDFLSSLSHMGMCIPTVSNRGCGTLTDGECKAGRQLDSQKSQKKHLKSLRSPGTLYEIFSTRYIKFSLSTYMASSINFKNLLFQPKIK